MKIVVLTCLLAVGSAPLLVQAQTSSPAPPASAAPAMPETGASPGAEGAPVDPAIVARAKDWLHRTQAGTIDRTQLDDKMNAAMTDAAVSGFAAQIATLGAPSEFVYVAQHKFPGNTAYKFHVTYKAGSFFWLFVLDDTGKISGLRLMPDQPPGRN